MRPSHRAGKGLTPDGFRCLPRVRRCPKAAAMRSNTLPTGYGAGFPGGLSSSGCEMGGAFHPMGLSPSARSQFFRSASRPSPIRSGQRSRPVGRELGASRTENLPAAERRAMATSDEAYDPVGSVFQYFQGADQVGFPSGSVRRAHPGRLARRGCHAPVLVDLITGCRTPVLAAS